MDEQRTPKESKYNSWKNFRGLNQLNLDPCSEAKIYIYKESDFSFQLGQKIRIRTVQNSLKFLSGLDSSVEDSEATKLKIQLEEKGIYTNYKVNPKTKSEFRKFMYRSQKLIGSTNCRRLGSPSVAHRSGFDSLQTNGCVNNCAADHRLLESFCKQHSTKLRKSSDASSGKVGGSPKQIAHMRVAQSGL